MSKTLSLTQNPHIINQVDFPNVRIVVESDDGVNKISSDLINLQGEIYSIKSLETDIFVYVEFEPFLNGKEKSDEGRDRIKRIDLFLSKFEHFDILIN